MVNAVETLSRIVKEFEGAFLVKTGYLLVAHKPLASAFKSVVNDIFCGDLEAVEAVDIDSDQDRQLQLEQLKKAWNSIETEQKVVLLDTFGATPGNVVCAFAKENNCECIAPLSLPLLMKLLCYRSQPLEVLMQKACEASQMSTRTTNENN